MSIFEFESYKDYLKAVVRDNKEIWGYQAKLAQAMDCQTSYLSQVLRAKPHLTSDHIAKLAKHLTLDEDETHYLLMLLELEKAGSQELRQHLSLRLQEMRRVQEDLSRKFKAEVLANHESQSCYYSAWYYAAIHILVGTGSFSTPAALARRLYLPTVLVETVLGQLESMEILKKDGARWTNTKKIIHLPKDSHLSVMNHSQWRNRAIADAQIRQQGSLHYTSVQSIAKQDVHKFRSLVTDAIEQTRTLVKKSDPEEAVCFNCDFFGV